MIRRRKPPGVFPSHARGLARNYLSLLLLLLAVAQRGTSATDCHERSILRPLTPRTCPPTRSLSTKRAPLRWMSIFRKDGVHFRVNRGGGVQDLRPLHYRGGAMFTQSQTNSTLAKDRRDAVPDVQPTGQEKAPKTSRRPPQSFLFGLRRSGGASEATEQATTQPHHSHHAPPTDQNPSAPTAQSTPTASNSASSAAPPSSVPSSQPPPPSPPQARPTEATPHRAPQTHKDSLLPQQVSSQSPPLPAQQLSSHFPPAAVASAPGLGREEGSLSASASSLPSPPSPPPSLSTMSTAVMMTSANMLHEAHGIFLPLPTVTPPKPRYLDVVSICANGTLTQRQVRKSELAVELRCPTRDLRILDTSFPSSVATFLARKNAIVVRMDRIRCVIRRDELMLFDPYNQGARGLIPLLQQQLATVAALTSAAGKNAPASLSPFELLSLEAVLASVCHQVHERLQVVSPQIMRILGDLKFRHGTLSTFPKLLDELLPLRNDLSELHYTVQELRKALNEVLLSDEDMEMMYLSCTSHSHYHRSKLHHQQHSSTHTPSSSSGASIPPPAPRATKSHRGGGGKADDSHQEVEMMFENYLMQLEWADTEIREVQHAIRNTEDTVEIQLDLLRNRILRFELVLNIVTSVVSVGCLVTGLFGMNLLSGLEAHPSAFYIVTVAGGVTMAAILALAFVYGIRCNIF